MFSERVNQGTESSRSALLSFEEIVSSLVRTSSSIEAISESAVSQENVSCIVSEMIQDLNRAVSRHWARHCGTGSRSRQKSAAQTRGTLLFQGHAPQTRIMSSVISPRAVFR